MTLEPQRLLENLFNGVMATDDGNEVIVRGHRLLQYVQKDPQLSRVTSEMRSEFARAKRRREKDVVQHNKELEVLCRLAGITGDENDDGERLFSSGIATRVDETAEPTCAAVDELEFGVGVHELRQLLRENRAHPQKADFLALDQREEDSKREWKSVSQGALAYQEELENIFRPMFGRVDFPDKEQQSVVDHLDGNQLMGMHGGRLRNIIQGTVDEFVREVDARLDSRAAKLALFTRFQTRCQYYDRKRLWHLADGNSKQAELLLTNEMAIYLFDQGLTPMPEQKIANQRADLVDSDNLIYVEAKQYKEKKGSRAHIVNAARKQIADMRQNMHLEITEAVLAVFRRGGPLYQFESPVVRVHDYRLYPFLIDVAPHTEVGSSAKHKAEMIRDDELTPEN